MRIVCLIDSLNSGGAQRQMCMLALLLKKHGWTVEVLTYFPHDFFAPLLQEAEVPYRIIPSKNKCDRIGAIRRAIRNNRPDFVIAFLNTPSLIAELAGLPKRNFKLIVSERTTTLHPGFIDTVFHNFHRLADAVVLNSHYQRRFLEKTAPYLKKKLKTIINCVDLNEFHPVNVEHRPNDPIHILIVANFSYKKNPLNFAKAIKIVRSERPEVKLLINWVGRKDNRPMKKKSYYEETVHYIREHSLQDIFKCDGPEEFLIPLYQGCTGFCLPSLLEGCPNVIAEAMACGKPILAGRICDNPFLVEDGRNGFLFDPRNPKDIAEKILHFSTLPEEQIIRMGRESRIKAEELLSPSLFVDRYIQLIRQLSLEK
jgi:glycosyltransferase involved in cell wall biosynthesis